VVVELIIKKRKGKRRERKGKRRRISTPEETAFSPPSLYSPKLDSLTKEK
jgi:hypothetical protein